MAVPKAAATVAWYRHGPTPGGRGSAVLAAHVDYNGRQGAFFRLRELRVGAAVTVTLEDGTGWSGVVQDVRSYSKRDLPVKAMFARIGPPLLRLITCGGPFDTEARHYRDNVVVSVAAQA
jgi:sortase (surface protein transpeptidase)